MNRPGDERGHTLVEMLVALAIAALLLQGLTSLLEGGLAVSDHAQQRNALIRDARFAMTRMVDAVADSDHLLLPLVDDPASSFDESVRMQTVPASPPQSGSTLDTAVLAVTLGRTQDLDMNGVPDADNDGDGRIDEDLPGDATDDDASGLRDIDDNGNGVKDEGFNTDDDESWSFDDNEDPLNGVDDDGDGSIDEDAGADTNNDGEAGVAGVDDDGDGSIDEGNWKDDDEDGTLDEDWYDPVVFYLKDRALIERRAVPWDENGDSKVDGHDVIESVLAEGITLLRFERVPVAAGQVQLVDITLAISDADGDSFELNTQVRLGGIQ